MGGVLPHLDARLAAALSTAGLPDDVIEEAGRRWWAAYRGRDEAQLLPGAADALRRLHAAGYPLALVTAGHRDNVGAQLRRHGLEALLPVRVHGDDLPEAKPHPAPLLRAVRELGLGPGAHDVAYVGDALDDMRMARAAGAHGVGIDSVLGDAAALRAAGADETAPSVAAWVDASSPGGCRLDPRRPESGATEEWDRGAPRRR